MLTGSAANLAAEKGGLRDAIAYCCRRDHLSRTLRIALVVGSS